MILRGLILVVVLAASACFAQTSFRAATYNVGLGRDGPGLLLKDIRAADEDILAVVSIIAEVNPDILLITNFDGDFRNLAATAFIGLLNQLPDVDYPYFFVAEGNSGVPSGLDLNGNGYSDDWADNWGFGLFPGHESMLLLSKFPLDATRSLTDSEFLWRDLPNVSAPKMQTIPIFCRQNLGNRCGSPPKITGIWWLNCQMAMICRF